MSTDYNVWAWDASATPLNNATADGQINWSEGQDPATVNNSARAMMTAFARYLDATSGGGGAFAVGGTADAITITTGQTISSGHQALGFRICFKAASTNTGAATVAVDGLSAVAIKRPNGDALSAGDIVSGAFHDIAFDGTNYRLFAAGVGGSYGSLSGSNTWTGTNTFQSGATIGDADADVVVIKGTTVSSFGSQILSASSALAWRNAIGLGTAATANLGTSGNTVPLLNGANNWTTVQSINAAAAAGGGVLAMLATNADNAVPVMTFYEPTGPRMTGSITYSGSVGMLITIYNTTSDGRLKQNRRPIDNSGAILDALQPLYYRWGGQGDEDFGFVAQDIAQIPQIAHTIVRGDDDPDKRPGQPGYIGWQTEKAALVPILVAEIKALRARVAALEAG